MSARPERGLLPDLSRMSDEDVRRFAESAERCAEGFVRRGHTELAAASWFTWRAYSADLATRERNTRTR